MNMRRHRGSPVELATHRSHSESRMPQDIPATRVDADLRAVDVLVDRADGDEIWRVLDYAEHNAVPIAEAYQAVIGDLPSSDTH
jgi:hypothetical protein